MSIWLWVGILKDGIQFFLTAEVRTHKGVERSLKRLEALGKSIIGRDLIDCPREMCPAYEERAFVMECIDDTGMDEVILASLK